MKLLITFAIVLCLAPTLRADWVIIQKTQTKGEDKTMTIKVKGDLIRSDLGTSMTALMNAKDGTAQMFIHKNKSVMKVNADTLKTAAGLANKLLGGSEAPAKPKATGEKVKVGEWDTEIYTWEGKIGSGKFYVAKDFPNFPELNKVMDKLSKSMSNPMSAMFPSNTDFPGMVVRSEMSAIGTMSKTELVSAKEEAVSDDEFKAPEGYKELKMPSLPGGLGK
jgi:hypothetical protein